MNKKTLCQTNATTHTKNALSIKDDIFHLGIRNKIRNLIWIDKLKASLKRGWDNYNLQSIIPSLPDVQHIKKKGKKTKYEETRPIISIRCKLDKTESKEFGCPLDRHINWVLDQIIPSVELLVDTDVLYKANSILEMKRLGR